MTEAVFQFPCKSCGGQMFFDSETHSLKCRYCEIEQPIEAITDMPVEHELNFADDDPSLYDWQTEQQTVKCESCGGQSVAPVSQSSFLCAFCGSAKVLVEQINGLIRPESLIPFSISKQEALEAFGRWKKKRWFVPNVFKKMPIESKLNGLYLPYWTYDASTASVYSADVGVYHYRPETRTRTVNGKTETYTEMVRYTVWHKKSGNYELDFDDVRIPASRYYDDKMLKEIGNYNMAELVGYKPDYISGYMTERYNVSLEDGWSRSKSIIDSTLNAKIRSKIGGDEIRNLRISTQYANLTYKQILLPMWNANYTYRNKSFPYMINGQTGIVKGKTPKSAAKITLFVLSLLAIIALLLLIASQS